MIDLLRSSIFLSSGTIITVKGSVEEIRALVVVASQSNGIFFVTDEEGRPGHVVAAHVMYVRHDEPATETFAERLGRLTEENGEALDRLAG